MKNSLKSQTHDKSNNNLIYFTKEGKIDSELLRNNYLADVLKWCRNPFIDDRNYACKIWGNTNSTTRALCGIH